ncbi:hypothetical protein OEA41_010272 [Lepraria neglecta]|uniref:UAA transporter n=1 Tax=Lepraria neglecta TaxID=209136 RepID=A0AAD9YW92_9LECA|nr:hypothetical protein OEA41_010272 [Lepraria neglecta]
MSRSTEAKGPRQRNTKQASNGTLTPPGTKTTNVQEEKPAEPDRPWTFARAMGVGAAMVHMTVPKYMGFVVMTSLIFGGCCSNVRLLITFIQFAVVALFTWPTHFSINRPPFFLKPPNVPLARWVPNILIFFAVNLLNNFAFGYNISVPVHIILRSGGSGKTSSSSILTIDPQFITGLSILFIAQLLSAIMGLYTQLTYAKYGSHWHENLFYSHFLSVPLFLPFFPSLLYQFKQLLSSPPILLTPFINSPSLLLHNSAAKEPGQEFQLPPILSMPGTPGITIPKHVLTLALNALTQYACIRGVNLLGARTTALGVSIVLNVRKLVSLFASIWLFGNTLPPGVVAGAAVVFSSAGVWAWEGQRISAREKEGKKKEEIKQKSKLLAKRE